MDNGKFLDDNGFVPTEAVGVKANLQTDNKTVTIFEVVFLSGAYVDRVNVFVAKVAASRKCKAEEIATKIFSKLQPEQIKSVAVEWCLRDRLDIVAVNKNRNCIQGHIWTQEESESDSLDRVVEQAAAEMLGDELAAMSS